MANFGSLAARGLAPTLMLNFALYLIRHKSHQGPHNEVEFQSLAVLIRDIRSMNMLILSWHVILLCWHSNLFHCFLVFCSSLMNQLFMKYNFHYPFKRLTNRFESVQMKITHLLPFSTLLKGITSWMKGCNESMLCLTEV